nr:hypothetical protein [Tanacetum cinerariifolium]GEZ55670.1 hypothetical protein [Tanacetum cinerariifolium]
DVRVSGGGEAIIYVMNHLIEDREDDVVLSMLLMDFKNAFNLVDREVMLKEVRLCFLDISRSSLQLMRETLAESSPPLSDVDNEDIDLGEWNINQCKRKICDGHYIVKIRVLSLSAVGHDRIKSFPRDTSYGRDGLCTQHLIDCLSGATFAIFDELVSSITQVVNLFLDGKWLNMTGGYIASASLTPLVGLCSFNGYLDDLQFDVRVSGGGEAIIYVMNHLIEDREDDVVLLMLLMDFKNAFNLVDREVMLKEVRLCFLDISH